MPKYLYEGFQKSAELYGQELLYLHEDAEIQARETGHILLTEGPFDVAMAVEAGLRNVVGSFGAALSERQAVKLKDMAECFGISQICIAYDRDEAGRNEAEKAASLLKAQGLAPVIFDWAAPSRLATRAKAPPISLKASPIWGIFLLSNSYGSEKGGFFDGSSAFSENRFPLFGPHRGHAVEVVLIVQSISVSDALLNEALVEIWRVPFTLRDLQQALEARGIDSNVSAKAAKRILQRERKSGTLIYDPDTGLWQQVGEQKEKPTTATDAPGITEPVSTTLRLRPAIPLPVVLSTKPPFWQRARNFLAMLLAYVACLSAVLALIAINASFAWEMAETEHVRYAFVAGLMASDLMRPLLVARGLWEFRLGHMSRGAAAIAFAVLLAPVSILSSTSVISAALYLGVEENAQAELTSDMTKALKGEIERLNAKTALAWQAWEDECARGFCGPIAAELELKAKAVEDKTEAQLKEMLALSNADRAIALYRPNGARV